MSVRAAQPGDEDAIFSLVEQLGHALTTNRAAFDRTIAEYFAGNHPQVLLYVADNNGKLCAYALTTIVPLLSTNGLSAQLQEIVVDLPERGKNYGTQLVEAVQQECANRGVTQLTVASRRAGGFYDRLGFHESAEYMRRFC